MDARELERGDETHRARDETAVDDVRVRPEWWSRVDRAPVGARGVDVSIPRGPYTSARDAFAELKRLAHAEGRSVEPCATTRDEMCGVLVCKGVTDVKKSERGERLPGCRCAYAARVEKWDRSGDGAPDTFWITEYVPHTHELCRSFTPRVRKSIEKVRLDAERNVQLVLPMPRDGAYQVILALDAPMAVPGLRTNRVNALERTCTCGGRATNGLACMHEYAVYLRARDDDALLRRLGMTDFRAWAAQPSVHAEMCKEPINDAFAHLPPPSHVTLDDTRRRLVHLRSATRRARARPLRPRRRVAARSHRR